MDQEKKKEAVAGPIIVATANSMRAFDAPARNPLLISALPEDFFWNPAAQNMTNALKLSSFSSFVVTIEHIIGALIITPLILIRRGYKHFISVLRSYERREWVSIVFISFGSGLGLYFFLISFALGNPTVAILLQKSQPLITLLVAMLLLKERPTKYYYIVALFALSGIFLISLEDILENNLFELMAALSSLVAAFFWGSNTVFGRILTDKTDYWDLTTFRYIGGATVLIVFNFIVAAYTTSNFNALSETFITFPEFFGQEFGIPMLGIFIIIYAAILTGGIIPLTLYYFGLRWSKASIGGLAELAFPLLAVFVNFIFLGFDLSVLQIFGAIILFASVTTLSYINAKEHEKESLK